MPPGSTCHHIMEGRQQHLTPSSGLLGCTCRSLSWEKLQNRDVSSPFRPKVGHVDSVENFDKLWTDMAPEDSPCNTPPVTDLDTFQVS